MASPMGTESSLSTVFVSEETSIGFVFLKLFL